MEINIESAIEGDSFKEISLINYGFVKYYVLLCGVSCLFKYTVRLILRELTSWSVFIFALLVLKSLWRGHNWT